MPKVLVTGSNRGIGLELCRQFCARGDAVVAACREASPALEQLLGCDLHIVEGVDVSDGGSIAQLASQLKNQSIDILINNAGLLKSERFGQIDYQQMLQLYAVNALGPLRVTEALAGNLEKGAKVIIITSRVGSIGDNSSGGNYGYRASKTALNQIGVNLKHEFLPKGIAIGLLHPGLVATEMTDGRGVSPEDAATGLIERIDALTLENSGGFWHAEGYHLPW